MRVIDASELSAHVGEKIGPSAPRRITQDQVDRFAEITDDHSWQHVDAERARQGPFGGTIAHGYLTLSLVPTLLRDCLRIDGARFGLNYGMNRVRFPSPVPVGAEVALSGRIAAVAPVPGGYQIQISVELAVTDAEKPCVVGDVIYNYYI